MSRAISIRDNGFKLSPGGRRGSGAYFWFAASPRCPYAQSLAVGWYNSPSRHNLFSKEPDPSGAIVWGKISAPSKEVLNLESPFFRDTLRKALEPSWSTISRKPRREIERFVSRIHEKLISDINAVMPVSIVLATVQPPPVDDPLKIYVGQPFALIIRKLSCLQIDSEIEGIPK